MIGLDSGMMAVKKHVLEYSAFLRHLSQFGLGALIVIFLDYCDSLTT